MQVLTYISTYRNSQLKIKGFQLKCKSDPLPVDQILTSSEIPGLKTGPEVHFDPLPVAKMNILQIFCYVVWYVSMCVSVQVLTYISAYRNSQLKIKGFQLNCKSDPLPVGQILTSSEIPGLKKGPEVHFDPLPVAKMTTLQISSYVLWYVLMYVSDFFLVFYSTFCHFFYKPSIV